LRVIQGTAVERRTTPLEEAYAHFRLDRQGLPVSPATLRLYEHTIGRFLRWVRTEHPEIRRFEDLDVMVVREYRAYLASRPGLRGKQIQPETLSGADRALRTFFRWATAEGYAVAPRILQLQKVRVPWKEPTLFHVAQLRKILAACNPRMPQEEVAVRLLVGAGVRRAELCGLAVEGPDGLPDLNLESLDRGVVELRVRGEAGAKGMRARRVPVSPKLGAAVKRYVARDRRDVHFSNLLINDDRRPYGIWGIDALMDRLTERVEFRIHAHAFRHTFATVATQLGWNFERLRAAMGHEDYATLQRYVRLAMERDLGKLEDWTEFVAEPPQVRMREAVRWA
jgi:site-specific recombinase XerD